MGFNNLRSELAKKARGVVLETSCGTGRNLSYYNADLVLRLILFDSSRAMLEQAQQKATQRNLKNVEIQHGSVEKLPFADGSIDTVIDTFGSFVFGFAFGMVLHAQHRTMFVRSA